MYFLDSIGVNPIGSSKPEITIKGATVANIAWTTLKQPSKWTSFGRAGLIDIFLEVLVRGVTCSYAKTM